MKQLLSIIVVVLLIAGCAQLAPNGAYHSDAVLFHADQTIVTGYELIHTYVKWENDYRAQLATTPRIKTSADFIRAHSKEWFQTAIKLREAYKLNPTPENSARLKSALSVIQTALVESTAYLSKYGPVAP